MIFNISLILFTLSTVNSFTSPSSRLFGCRLSTKLLSRTDSSEAVKAALEASKQYGATSKEARLAWEAVEEMDSSDNRYVFRIEDQSISNLTNSTVVHTVEESQWKNATLIQTAQHAKNMKKK